MNKAERSTSSTKFHAGPASNIVPEDGAISFLSAVERAVTKRSALIRSVGSMAIAKLCTKYCKFDAITFRLFSRAKFCAMKSTIIVPTMFPKSIKKKTCAVGVTGTQLEVESHAKSSLHSPQSLEPGLWLALQH
jgi:hypothetical protein